MGKFIKWFVILGSVLAAFVGALLVVVTYWQKILSYAVAAKHLGSNVLNAFGTEKNAEDDANDYYDI
jgi:glycerol uptake facilitator-like aquaporin